MQSFAMSGPKGYPLTWFVSKPVTNLVCDLCSCVLNNPHQCKNGHLFCLNCLHQCTKCQICDVKVSSASIGRSLFAERIVNNLIVKCKCSLIGPKTSCTWTGTLTDSLSRDCAFEVITCTNGGCDTAMQRVDMDQHAHECEKRVVNCTHCAGFYPADSLSAHEEECTFRPVNCECSATMAYCELDAHKTTDCLLTVIDCPMFAFDCCGNDCSGQITRGEMDGHIDAHTSRDTVEQLLTKLIVMKAEKEVEHTNVAAAAVVIPAAGDTVTNKRPRSEECEKMTNVDHGDAYVGEINAWGERHGRGKYTWPKSTPFALFYDGEWANDQRHGQGVMKTGGPTSGLYQGEYAYDKRHGTGTYTYDNGNVYTGEWRKGVRSGQGKMTYADGTVYEGKWKQGNPVN